MYDGLPAGLDPVQAGRFGLWLLGQRSHRRAQLRTVSASRVPGSSLAQRFVLLFMPWRITQYPGRHRFLPVLCGVSIGTARLWLYREEKLPPKHARRMAEVARAHAEECLRVAEA